MTSISRSLRARVVQRARGLCEYCQTPQTIVIEMEIDHIVPESAGGQTVSDNLCLACASCNSRKGYAQSAIDLQTNQAIPLFNPRTQIWRDHFQWNDNKTHLIGLTPTGRATIDKLQINRDVVVEARKRWVAVGWHPPAEL